MVCNDIDIYHTADCRDALSDVCAKGSKTTVKVCHEEPDEVAPSSGAGSGGLPGSGGSTPPPPPKPDCDALNNDILNQYLACKPSSEEYQKQLNSCPQDKDITRTIGVGGAGYTGGFNQVVTYNPGKSCRDSWTIAYNAGLKDCEDSKKARVDFLPAACKK